MSHYDDCREAEELRKAQELYDRRKARFDSMEAGLLLALIHQAKKGVKQIIESNPSLTADQHKALQAADAALSELP